MLALSWYAGLEWIYWVLLVVVLITGFLVNILGLPGLWLMLLGHIIFAFVTTWDNYTGWHAVLTLFGLAVVAEIVEFVAGAAGSAQAGGTKRGMGGAIVGGLVGGIAGSILIPIPIVGTIIGAVAGSFAGAAVIERMIEEDNTRAIKIGIGAAKGRFYGIIIKSCFGILMLVISMITALPIGGSSAIATTQLTTSPSSQPTTFPTTAP